MTRKDYELVAQALRDARPTGNRWSAEYRQGWLDTVTTVADGLGVRGNFDRDRFLRASGVGA